MKGHLAYKCNRKIKTCQGNNFNVSSALGGGLRGSLFLSLGFLGWFKAQILRERPRHGLGLLRESSKRAAEHADSRAASRKTHHRKPESAKESLKNFL